MDADRELESWRRAWQANDTVPPDLRQSVERGTRRLRRGLVSEIAVTIVMGGGSAAWALMLQRTDAVVLSVGIWVFIAVAWVQSRALNRDLWKPVAETHAAFLDLSILRCRRALQAITAQSVLYVMIAAFDLVWIYYHRLQTESLDPWTFFTAARLWPLWVVTVILAIVAILYRGRLRRELQTLEDLRRQLATDGATTSQREQ